MQLSPRNVLLQGVVLGILAVTALGLSARAHAESFDGFNIYSPHVDKGETELETRAYYFSDNNDEVNRTRSVRAAVGHAFTGYWATEVYGTYTKKPHEGGEYEVEWENRFQLTPQNKYWADVGALVELERESPSEGGKPFEVRYGVLLEKQVYRWVSTLNLFLENQFGPNASGATEFQYVGRVRYLLNSGFQPGFEFYGAPGRINSPDTVSDQTQDIGPGFSGTLSLGNARALNYSAALLFGVTDASPAAIPVARLEYEFY